MSGARYDAVVLGAGPAGEVATGILAEAGLKVALVERELVGGECGYWACIPSKTLLRPPEARHESAATAGVSEPELDWRQVAAYCDWMIRNLDDSGAVAGYEQQGVTVFKTSGKLAGPGRVEVDIRAEIPVAALKDTIVQFPTFREAYVSALRKLPQAAMYMNTERVGCDTEASSRASTLFDIRLNRYERSSCVDA